MYICMDCGHKFTKAQKFIEKHGFTSPPYEEKFVCPACQSDNYHKLNCEYCRFCGARLRNGAIDYCSDKCRRRGKIAWLKEKRRKQYLAESDIYKKVKSVENYNLQNRTNLSYGQYVALIDGKEKKK